MTDGVSPSYAPGTSSTILSLSLFPNVDASLGNARDRSDSKDDPYSPEIARPIERFLFLSFPFVPSPLPPSSSLPENNRAV